jgi:hypothetical protein
MTLRPCRGPHPLLLLESPSSMGAFVRCCQCQDTFHATTSFLEENYFHALYVTGSPATENDMDFFIHEGFVTRRVKG